ncbi:ArsR family transcriptional regulator [Halobacteriales archaeon QS_8_69_26]|nr:MAG: ArsR family transcriptional regulator [Halobacteriales archaeon QS_8_69_26]
MRDLDETDVEILRLLAEDGRRPYSDIADRVDLSPPAVSDRVDRLREQGVIRRFTADIDRTKLRESSPVLVTLAVEPASVDAVRESLAAAPAVEHVFTTANARVVFNANVPRDVRGWLLSTVDPDAVREYDVDPIESVEWRITVEGTDFAVSCAECGNTVTEEGVTARVGGEVTQFCCPSCEERYRDRYEELAEAAGEGG